MLSQDALRSLVREWTLFLKEEGFLPEKALVAVKALVREAISPHIFHYNSGDPAHDVRRELIADASQCCIDTYFNRAPGVSSGEQQTSGEHRPSTQSHNAAECAILDIVRLERLDGRRQGIT